ncbi:outer membrane protein assembly factor BamD [Pontibacter cellulosilyticus]|uniref:outer membrane protein assembly factor BamD n=1 Tax=Pontibacter cellulosilyticus TaxID=1720253 RepID=UPI001C9A488E|nr:outer membrane protein assembly factor BamD [Pontibacter cellulosilyticus]
MKKGFLHTVVIVGLLLVVSGCSNFQKLLKSDDVEKKYKAALEYYEKEDYYRANQLLEQVSPLLTGSEQAEQAKFYLADTYYEMGDYLLADFHFKTFYQTYPRSPLAEQAMYNQALALYNQSPSFEQDQTTTVTAIEALQEFMVRYPSSDRVKEANELIDELLVKLDKKAFDNARLYYQLRNWRSAVVALDNFLKEHASSPYSEEAAFLKLDAQYRYALESIPSKQEERLQLAAEYYQNFIDQYPDSKFTRNALQVYEDTLANLEKIKKSNNQAQANS